MALVAAAAAARHTTPRAADPCPPATPLPTLRAQSNDLEQQPGRTVMESFENQVNQVRSTRTPLTLKGPSSSQGPGSLVA